MFLRHHIVLHYLECETFFTNSINNYIAIIIIIIMIIIIIIIVIIVTNYNSYIRMYMHTHTDIHTHYFSNEIKPQILLGYSYM